MPELRASTAGWGSGKGAPRAGYQAGPQFTRRSEVYVTKVIYIEYVHSGAKLMILK